MSDYDKGRIIGLVTEKVMEGVILGKAIEGLGGAKGLPSTKSLITPGQQVKSLEQVPESIRGQMPKNWGVGRQADNTKGWVWTDPNNRFNEIRYMTGDPSSKFTNSQSPYMRVTQEINGQRRYLDANGNIGVNRTTETHFEPESFDIKNYQF